MHSATDLLLLTLRLGMREEISSPDGIAVMADDSLWQEVIDLARPQGVLAICLDGAVKLLNAGVETGMSRNLQHTWFSKAANYEQRFLKYSSAIAGMKKFYASHGLDMMLIKGYGLAMNYPVPSHRPCGDIDIWLFGRQEEADSILEREKGVKIDHTHHIHTVFKANGITVENHYDFFNPYSFRSNARINDILEEEAYGQNCRKVPVMDTEVTVPSADFNALYLLRHSAQHFAAMEITLRHLLDWGTFCRKWSGQISWDRLLPIVRKLNMDRFLGAIDDICTDYLGFDRSSFPGTQRDYDLEMKVFDAILAPEYPDSQKPDKGLLKIIFWKLRRWNSNSWKHRIVYNESRLETFFAQIHSHFLKPKMLSV